MSYVIKFTDGEYNDHGFAVKKNLAQKFDTKKAATTAAKNLIDVDCIEEFVPAQMASVDDLISAIEKSTVQQVVLIPHVDQWKQCVEYQTHKITYVDAQKLVSALKQNVPL